MRPLALVALVQTLAVVGSAQFQSTLTTSFVSNNACYGNIFDITAINDVTICSFDINIEPGASTINVWAVTGGGTWNQPGVLGTASAWTLLAQVNVVGNGIGVPTPLNLNLGYPIPAAGVQGFVIEKTVQAAPTIRYNNGTAYGAPLASNADLAILQGGGICGALFTPNAPRTFSGTILYEPGILPTCFLPPPPGEYQTNQPGASLSINGQPDPGAYSFIQQVTPIGVPATLNFASTNVLFPWDVALVVGGTPVGLSGAGIAIGNQIVNVDLTSPNLSFAFGGAFPNLSSTVFPAPAFNLPFSSPAPLTLALQMITIDPSTAEGIALSHACRLTVQ